MTHHGPQLITYADRLAGDIAGLRELLDGPLAGAFTGVHVLPFYPPYDGADAGFDPRDHTEVDPRLGTWDDVRALAQDRTVMADVIVNHVSAESDRFLDVREHGDASPHAPMFLTLGSVFPDGATEEDLARIYRPRPGLPFTVMSLGGRRRLVWTTFTPDQVDIDLRTPQAWEYLDSVVDALTGGGVTVLRLDAVGYTGKEAGTDCFMTPATDAYTARIVERAHARGAQVLVEVHGHYLQQVEIARKVDLVYDFALPPLVLHALTAADLGPLDRWLRIRPTNAVTVLDTHDGIGIVDVGTSDLLPGEPGLLGADEIDALVERIHVASDGASRLATGAAASNLDLYQVNCTFYDALARDDRSYLLARLLQLFVPGVPQVYYVGLLAGTNDMERLARTGVGRDVNRHHYTPAEVDAALRRPVVRAQLEALRLRASHRAFEGTFSHSVSGTRATLRWACDDAVASLVLDVADCSFEVRATSGEGTRAVLSSAALGGVADGAGSAEEGVS
ncbi:sucrose phosphorylase [Xylanimonas oleitrophica]|uniref:Sucrose phosphorylase n=1 Tax=Xylanimonas oleitrophica TaxID=2607479 RepID=A0A2W5XU68_9MICO|nr:sucrose phosphorylase [Xylanimonas oleitrophica]PZR53748.1 sucrose phosphorylase [Xylanimonas oleitrophica]